MRFNCGLSSAMSSVCCLLRLSRGSSHPLVVLPPRLACRGAGRRVWRVLRLMRSGRPCGVSPWRACGLRFLVPCGSVAWWCRLLVSLALRGVSSYSSACSRLGVLRVWCAVAMAGRGCFALASAPWLVRFALTGEVLCLVCRFRAVWVVVASLLAWRRSGASGLLALAFRLSFDTHFAPSLRVVGAGRFLSRVCCSFPVCAYSSMMV